MKKEQLSELLGQVDDDLLLEADRKRKQPRRKLWIPIVALAACLCLIVGLAAPALWNRPTSDNPPSGSGQPLGTEKTPIQTNATQPRVLRSPVYPTSAPYPTESFEDWDAYFAQYEAWILERDAANEAGNASDRAVNAFTEATAPTFLMNAGTENRVYSPVNVYLALWEPKAFRKFMYFVMLTYSATIVTYIIWPTCQNLRPESFQRDNFLTRFAAGFYAFDTNTNVCPSLHVIGSYAVAFGAWDSRRFSKPGWKLAYFLMATLISVATVFVKQHSVVDVFWAMIVCAAGYLLVYVLPGLRDKHKEKAYGAA